MSTIDAPGPANRRRQLDAFWQSLLEEFQRYVEASMKPKGADPDGNARIAAAETGRDERNP